MIEPMRVGRLFFRFAACCALFLCSQLASAGLFDDDEARRAIIELRQNHADLKQQVDGLSLSVAAKQDEESKRATEDATALRRSLIELQNQLDASRAELAKLRGVSEQLAKDLADVQKRQKDFVQSADDRLKRLEPFRITVDGREFTVEPLEKRDYDTALATFRKGDFVGAQVAIAEFLNRYAQTGYRASALFWLGNAQFATKDYKEAIQNFRAFIAAGADHPKVAEGMLAIANCQLELKEQKAAKKTLEELVASFPGSEAASAAKERLAKLR